MTPEMATTSERFADIDRELGTFGKTTEQIDAIRDRVRAENRTLESVDQELASLSNGTERMPAIPTTRTHAQPPPAKPFVPPPPVKSLPAPPKPPDVVAKPTPPAEPPAEPARAERVPLPDPPRPVVKPPPPRPPEPPPPRAPVFKRSVPPEPLPAAPPKPAERRPFDEPDETLPGPIFPAPVATTKSDPRLSAFDLFDDDFASNPPAPGPAENSSVEIANLLDDHLADTLANEKGAGELSDRLEAEIDLPAAEATEVFAAPNFAALERKLLDEADDVRQSLVDDELDSVLDQDDIEVVVDDFETDENTASDVPAWGSSHPPPTTAAASPSTAPKNKTVPPENEPEDPDAPKKGFFKKLFGG
jgi:hypothetical protein